MKNTSAHNQSVKIAVYTLLSLWFLFAILMGIRGHYVSSLKQPPLNLGLTLLLPMLFFIGAYLRRGSLWAFAQTLDLRVITLAHFGRLIGILFLVDYAQGRLPGGFAFPAGIGDMITGLAAIPLVLSMNRRIDQAKKSFIAWNLFGMADLIIAVTAGIAYSSSSLGILAGNGPTTLLINQFPQSLIPTFIVPVYLLLHLLALARVNELGGQPSATIR